METSGGKTSKGVGHVGKQWDANAETCTLGAITGIIAVLFLCASSVMTSVLLYFTSRMHQRHVHSEGNAERKKYVLLSSKLYNLDHWTILFYCEMLRFFPLFWCMQNMNIILTDWILSRLFSENYNESRFYQPLCAPSPGNYEPALRKNEQYFIFHLFFILIWRLCWLEKNRIRIHILIFFHLLATYQFPRM